VRASRLKEGSGRASICWTGKVQHTTECPGPCAALDPSVAVDPNKSGIDMRIWKLAAGDDLHRFRKIRASFADLSGQGAVFPPNLEDHSQRLSLRGLSSAMPAHEHRVVSSLARPIWRRCRNNRAGELGMHLDRFLQLARHQAAYTEPSAAFPLD
jgi:hypothetical protein